MDRRSWLWRRKPSEKSTGVETESSGSPSSHSARFSDDQEVLKVSPNHAQSPDISSKSVSDEGNATAKALTEKLSSALLNISAKEDLVNQHAKVAEEAVLGWEKAEKEVSALKQQLHAAAQKNSNLEGRIGHLDDALKECLRQLRQLRQDQEQKIHDALIQQSQKWESEKLELERKAVDLRAPPESKAGTPISFDRELLLKLDSLEKENSALKAELMSYRKDLQIRTAEKELLTKAAEAASKQHLESVKKAAKLKAECRRLRASARKSTLANQFRPAQSSVCVESAADSLSDCGSDSWASALINELHQFKTEKRSTTSVTPSAEIDLMDDFLEMERLAALPEASLGSSTREPEADSECTVRRSCLLQRELEDVSRQMVESKTENREVEKALEKGRYLLLASSEKSDELQRQVNVLNGEKHALEVEAEAMEAKRGESELQLDVARMEIGDLKKRVGLLQRKVEDEMCYSEKLKAWCTKIDALEARKNEMELLLESALSDARMLRDKASFLEKKVEENTALLEKEEAKKKEVEFELGLAHKEIVILKEKVSSLERKVDEEKALSIEFESKYQEMEDSVAKNEELTNMYYRSSLEAKEARVKELEDQLYSANLEVEMLQKKASSLEENVEEERKLSAANAVEIEASKVVQKETAAELALAQSEVAELRGSLEFSLEEVLKEKASSAKLAARCQNLEDELFRRKGAYDHKQPTIGGDLNIKQERERGRAADKLAECQKTIASLHQQLKTLASFDDLLLEAEKMELTVENTLVV